MARPGQGMTSRQRVLAALHGQEPDRVPFLEVAVDLPVALAAVGGMEPEGPASQKPGPAEKRISVGTMWGCPVEDDLWRPLGRAQGFGANALRSPGRGMELAHALGLDGLGMHLFVHHERVHQEIDGRSMVVDGRIKTRADLNRIELPDPDDPTLYEPYRRFVQRYRDAGLALFCYLNLGSDPTIQGMGFQTFALALYDDRALVEDLFALYTAWYARVVRHLCALDFDFLWFGDDIAFKSGPFISPTVFRELFMPHYRRVAEQIRKPWIFHSDGNLMPILDDLLELGMHGLHPIEPGAMDLREVKRRYGGRVCLCGHISVDALSRGAPQEVEELVREAIRVAAPGGGYIAGSSNSITSYCRPENVRAMQHAILTYGRYPIRKEV